MTKKKSFEIGDEGRSNRGGTTGSHIDMFLGEEGSGAEKKNQRKEEAPSITEKENADTGDTPSVIEDKSPSSSQKKSKPKDRRTVEDKKQPFSTVLRGKLLEKTQKTLKQYRQQVDFEYNMAQLVEDAITSQVAKLQRKMK